MSTTYTVVAPNLQFTRVGKEKRRKLAVGDEITEEEFTAQGVNVQALVAGGLVTEGVTKTKTKKEADNGS